MNHPEADAETMDQGIFADTLELLEAAATGLANALQNTTLQREERDQEKRRIADIMRDYRAAVPAFFAPGHPVRESPPDLYPAPGHTPAAVVASGTWDAAEAKARITFSPSEDVDLDSYVLRYCPGAEYKTADEITLATVEPEEPREFLTLVGLDTPGATGLYRVYVTLTTGNEKGSNTVAVTRPPE